MYIIAAKAESDSDPMDIAVAKRRDASAALAAYSRFGKFGNEPLHDVRAAKVETNQAIECMKDAWRSNKFPDYNDLMFYNKILDTIKNHDYSAKDVESFSILLAGFQDEREFSDKAGLFLSALINNCHGDGFIIRTAHISVPIHQLGYRNTKNVTVEGDAGDDFGIGMGGGTLIVVGHAGVRVGLLMGMGTLIVRGNAGNFLGEKMKNGSIRVEGDAEHNAGCEMKGGTITVNGKAGHVVGDRMEGGILVVMGDVGLGTGS